MYRGGQSARGYEDYTRPNGGYINLGAPSSPGQPISVPTAYGTGPHDRYIPGRAPVASSSFHASGPNAYGNHPSVPGPGLWGQSGSMTGRRGGGYADRQRDDDWRAWAEPSGWGSGDRDEDRAKRHKAKGLARAQARPPRAPSDSPNKKARKAAEKRKAEQDAQSAADFERKAAAARRREDFKRQALAKAKMIRPDSPAAEGENVRALGATDLLFEMKKSARSQSTDGTSKATRNAGQDASSKRETEKRKKNVEKGKGKGRASDQESLDHYYTRENKKPTSKTRRSSQTETGRGRLKKARGGRGGFEDSDDDGRVSTPPASPRRSPRKKDKGKGKARLQTSGAVTVESDDDLEIVEKEKTLEELFRQDREEADEAERAARGESAVPQPTQALLKLRADRLDSPDPLLENDNPVADPDTLCPFCDGLLPDEPSDELVRLKRYLLDNPDADRRPTMKNRKAIRLPNHVVATAAFCQRHRNEREVIPEGLHNGYPRDIDFDELPERISRLLSEHLTRVLMGKTATPFLEPAIERAEAAGKRRNVIGEYGSFDVEEPGYYGPRGLEVMFTTIKGLFTEGMPLLTAQRTRPLDVDFYVRRVLIPECAVELIRHDYGFAQTTREQAEAIREDSRAYGKAVFPSDVDAADEGRGMTLSPPKKRSRSEDGSAKKRKRRKEAEIVESDADDSPSPSPVKQVSRPAFRQPKQLKTAKEGTGSTASSSASSSKSLASGSGKSSKTTALTIPSSESESDKPPPSAQLRRKSLAASSSGLFDDFKRDVEDSSTPESSTASSSDDELKEVPIELDFAKRNARAKEEEATRKRRKAADKAARTRKARQERGKETVLSSSESD